jgi:hypothetical protein
MMDEVEVHELEGTENPSDKQPATQDESNEDQNENQIDEDTIQRPRSLLDIITANHLPARPLLFAIISFLICFEVLVEIGGILIDRNYSILFSVSFLIAPGFWGWFFCLSREHIRKSYAVRRGLQAIMLGYFTDTVVYLTQWVIVYGLMKLIKIIYHALDRNDFVRVTLLVILTLFESVFLEAIPEEVLKYLILLFISKQQPLPSKYSAVVYIICATLGFIFFSGTLRILRVYWISGFYPGWGFFFIEVFLTTTMHIICGLWTGTNFVKQTFRSPDKDPIPTWRVVLPSITLHSIYISFLQVLYLLYELKLLTVELIVLVVIFALISLAVALIITVLSVRRLMFDRTFYSLLTPEGEPAPLEEGEEMNETA